MQDDRSDFTHGVVSPETKGRGTCRNGIIIWLKGARKIPARLPAIGSSNSHGARPVNLIITIIK